MKYVQLINTGSTEPVYGKIDDDGLMRITCGADNKELQDWLADGNTAEEWQPDAITEPVVEPTIEPDTTTESVEP